jgi:hypothetical protein
MRRKITPDRQKHLPSYSQVTADSTSYFRNSHAESKDHAKDANGSGDNGYDSQAEYYGARKDRQEDEEGDEDEDGDEEDEGDKEGDEGDDEGDSSEDDDENGNARAMNERKKATSTTSAFSVGSISSVGLGSLSAHTNISVSSSAQNSIMERLLFNIAVDPEPFPDDQQSTLTSFNLPDIERPQKRQRIQCSCVPSQPFPDKSLPTELLDDFIKYMKEYKASKRYEIGKYSDVTLIIMNYALKKHLLVKKYLDPEQLNIRWMFEFWRLKEIRMPSLFGGRNEYSQKEERAIERGLYKYPPFYEIDMNGNKIFTYRWNKIFCDETYHELLKNRSPQSIRDKARGTRNREGESIVALYHVQCKYRLKLHMLVRNFSVEMQKKKKEILMKKNLSKDV